jgi:kinesin family protein 4/21/27
VGPDDDVADGSSGEQVSTASALVQAGDRTGDSTVAGVAKDKLAAMADEATCTSPTTIKACYAPQQAGGAFDAAAAAAAAADGSSSSSTGGGASTTTNSGGGGASLCSSSAAAAYEVLEFKQAQPEAQLPCEGAPEAPDALQPVPPPQLLARFRVNSQDTLAVFRAVSGEDFADVAGLLPANSAVPAADKMTYLLARLEVCVLSTGWWCVAAARAGLRQCH